MYRLKRILSFFVFQLLISFSLLHAQHDLSIVITDSLSSEKLFGATVLIENTTIGGVTNADGAVVINNIPSGNYRLVISYVGYVKKYLNLTVPLTDNLPVQLMLQKETTELEEIIVTSTRVHSRVEETPIKVEVLGMEDMNEENSIKPGNVASIIGDLSGIQIQPVSAVSGNSVVRMQGLDSKYTLLLRDGMPAFGGLSGGLNILQIPPLDLKQIEIIKGPASTLFGGGAIAGLINFITKEPTDKQEIDFTLNQSTLKETNANTYISGKINDKLGYTLFGGYTFQRAVDVSKDGFSDVPDLNSFIIHPQLFYKPDTKTKIRLGVTASHENRMGGDMRVLHSGADSLHQFFEKNLTNYVSSDIIAQRTLSENSDLSFKGTVNRFDRTTNTNYSSFNGNQANAYTELSYSFAKNNHGLIIGGNYLFDAFHNTTSDTVGLKNFNNHTFGLFSLYSYNLNKKINFQAGLRSDHHNRHGWFVIPSAAVLFHLTESFSLRLNGGDGYKIPNALDAELKNINMYTTNVFNSLRPERSYGSTMEWNYKKYFGDNVKLYFNQTFFYTRIVDGMITTVNALGQVNIVNAGGPIVTKGIDNYMRISYKTYELYLGYTYTDPRKKYDSIHPYLPITPLHRAAGTFVDQFNEHWRAGLEVSYTGQQFREDGSKTRSFTFIAAMIQYKVGHYTFVLNGENLLDFRQNKYEKVVVVPTPNSQPTFATLWGPLDGRAINFSVLIKL
jgi:outer membrane receptor for ferrienterochelin and colicins